jgi:hypothetical protein
VAARLQHPETLLEHGGFIAGLGQAACAQHDPEPEMEIESICERVTGKLGQVTESVALMLLDEFPQYFAYPVFEGMQKQTGRLQ